MKKYIYGFIAVIIGLLILETRIQSGKISRLKIENSRVQANNVQLFGEKRQQTTLYLKEKELTRELSTQRDSLAKALKIRPKQVEKIVYRDNTIRDTVIKEVPVIISGKNEWKISDKDKCWSWNAIANLNGDSLKVNRTGFDYHNRTTETYYQKRPKKFLFIHYGKKQNYIEIKPECGEVTVKSFVFVK
jgi:hypothetical protein